MGRKLTEQEIKDRINNKFPNKFDFSLWKFISYKDKVTLICKDCGNICNVTPAYLLASKTKFGCKQCYLNLHKFSLQKVIDNIKSIFGKNRFDFSKFHYIDAKHKVTLICNKCGNEFLAVVNDLTRKRHVNEPCPICYRKSLSKTLQEFILELNEKFPNKYDTSLVNYVNAKTKIILICKDCNTLFETTPDNILTSVIGCPVCANINRGLNRRKSTELFIVQSKLIHGNKYDYSKVNYITESDPVTIICSKHGEFLQTPKSHLRGCGCPRCKNSRGEYYIEQLLKLFDIPYTRQYNIKIEGLKRGIFVDFEINKDNKQIFIEYNGVLHYRPIQFFGGIEKFENYLLVRDSKLKLYCKDNNIELIEIKYDLSNIDMLNILQDSLKKYGFLFNK